MLMGTLKAAMDVYILHKFGGHLSGSYAVNADHFMHQTSISTRVNSSTFTRGKHVNFVFRYYSL